jgi:hypothetical protein
VGLRSRTIVVLLAASVAALGGCKGAKSSGNPTPAVTVTGTSGGPSGAATSAPPKQALPTNGKCVLVTAAQASTLLGAAATGSAANHGADEDIIFIDGCSYTSSAGNVGYDINDFKNSAASPVDIVKQAKAAMGAQGGVTAFTVPGGDESIGFTLAVGGKTMARIEIASGTYTIAVNAVMPDAGKAKLVALDTAAALLAAVG